MRNIVRLGLFCFGVLLQFTSFWVAQVEQAGWVLNIVSPKSVRGMAGVRILATETPLEQNDQGFREISDIVKMRFRELYPNENWDNVDVMKCLPEGKQTITGMGINLGGVGVRFLLSNGKDGKLRTDHLRSEFEKMRKWDVFCWSLGLLIVGIVVVQVPLFLIESGARAKSTTGKKKPG
jgi:hypothetical protein